MSASCFGGGGGQQNGDVVLTVWKTFEDSETLQPLFDAYTQKHPNVQIVYSKKNVENYEKDLLNALAAGNGPDIFSIHNSWLPKYADKAEPASDQVFTLRDFKDAFVDVVAQDFTKDSKIYGVALSVDSLALFYNKDLLGSSGIATPPKTWTELVTQVAKIKKQDRNGYFTRSGVAIGTNTNVNRAVDILSLFMLQQGVVAYDKEGANPLFAQSIERKGVTYSPGLLGLAFYTSFANPTTANYNWNYSSDYSIDAFVNGRTAYLYSYAYTRKTIAQKAPNLNYDVAQVPQPNLEDPTVNFANYWGEVVSKQSKNKEWAWDLLKFISNKDQLSAYYAQDKKPSSRRDLIELQIPDSEIGVFAAANLTAKSFYKPDQVIVDNIFGQMIDNVVLRGVSAQDALDQAEQQASTITRE